MDTINLEAAKHQLESLIGARLPSIVPDAIDAVLGNPRWERIPAGIENHRTMAELLGLTTLPPDTALVVVTDPSFGEGVGAFTMRMSQFDEFQTWHLDTFAERFFSGCDVILWAPVEKRLWIVHHEGVYVAVQLGNR